MSRMMLSALMVGFVGNAVRADDPMPEPEMNPAPAAPAYLPFRSSALAELPNAGYGDPAQGYPHYDAPSRHYGLWLRPEAFGRGPEQRCTEPDFNPRGLGNLFADSCLPYRMEYHPAVLVDPRTPYGPSYMVNPVAYNCCDHGKCGLCGGDDDCPDGRCGKRSRWTSWLNGKDDCEGDCN